MSRKAIAEYLGVSLRTVRYWEAGRSRVPWSVVRLLRFKRLGDLGALEPAWAGWVLNRNGIFSPDARNFTIEGMRTWWITLEQARFWRQGYDAATRPSAGRTVPAAVMVADGDSLQPEAGMAAKQAAAALSLPIEAASTLTAFARRRQRLCRPPVGMAVSLSQVAVGCGSAAAARSDAGLVNLSTSGTRYSRSRMAEGLRRVHGR